MQTALNSSNQISAALIHDLKQLRKTSPLIHNITNYVAMSVVANVLLALGASPLMAHAPEELAEINKIANALVLNIGTLDQDWINSMRSAQQLALKNKLPIILDPVGSGATQLRTNTVKDFLQQGVTLIRGNSSEILSLVDASFITKGVDSTLSSDLALSAAKLIAKQYQCIVVISGATDWIVDQQQIVTQKHGSPWFTKATAMGCSVSAVIAAFTAINSNYFQAALNAMITFSIAGELAEKSAKGPGSFVVNLLDELFLLEPHHFQQLKIENYNDEFEKNL